MDPPIGAFGTAGGVRERAPEPPDPIGDHNELVEMLRARELREQEGW